jgi:hypothetical protein
VANGIADNIVNAINNSIASSKGYSPVHVKVNDLAKTIDKDRVNRIVKWQMANGKVNITCYALGDANINVGSNALSDICNSQDWSELNC